MAVLGSTVKGSTHQRPPDKASRGRHGRLAIRWLKARRNPSARSPETAVGAATALSCFLTQLGYFHNLPRERTPRVQIARVGCLSRIPTRDSRPYIVDRFVMYTRYGTSWCAFSFGRESWDDLGPWKRNMEPQKDITRSSRRVQQRCQRRGIRSPQPISPSALTPPAAHAG